MWQPVAAYILMLKPKVGRDGIWRTRLSDVFFTFANGIGISMRVLQGTNQATVKNHIFISRETELSISAPDLVGFQLG